MARSSRMSAQKRLREQKKAEKAATKREQRASRKPSGESEPAQVASREDLESYGIGPGATRDESPR